MGPGAVGAGARRGLRPRHWSADDARHDERGEDGHDGDQDVGDWPHHPATIRAILADWRRSGDFDRDVVAVSSGDPDLETQ
ncbi:MAG: hypothetical protein M3507_08855 [Actinomycetota bacterium]|nr:hypothetical protein [Actinomycetota bacterium]